MTDEAKLSMDPVKRANCWQSITDKMFVEIKGRRLGRHYSCINKYEDYTTHWNLYATKLDSRN